MTQIFLATFPFFTLILCGYVATRLKLLPVDAIPGLNVFVLYFALPCMLFRFGASTPIEKLLDAAVFFTYCTAALLLVVITISTTRSASTGWNDASFGALVAAFPNTGFMGMPLLLSIAGPRVAGPIIISLSTDLIVTSSLCVALSRLSIQKGDGLYQAARRALKGTIINPLPWAILFGGIASYMTVKVYAPMMHVVEMLADTGSPMGLFAIGTVLARSHMTGRSGPEKHYVSRDSMLIVFYKLVLHPALVLGIGNLAIEAGLPLDWFSLSVLVLVAALPSASNVPILAERFGASTARLAHIVLISTTLSFLTFSSIMASIL
jgi:predicted permease